MRNGFGDSRASNILKIATMRGPINYKYRRSFGDSSIRFWYNRIACPNPEKGVTFRKTHIRELGKKRLPFGDAGSGERLCVMAFAITNCERFPYTFSSNTLRRYGSGFVGLILIGTGFLLNRSKVGADLIPRRKRGI